MKHLSSEISSCLTDPLSFAERPEAVSNGKTQFWWEWAATRAKTRKRECLVIFLSAWGHEFMAKLSDFLRVPEKNLLERNRSPLTVRTFLGSRSRLALLRYGS